MEIQGVVFYALTGDHPQAGPRKLRLGIPGTATTVEVFRDLLCQTHNIDPQKSRVDIQYFATREAVPPATTLRNYDELRVNCTRRQLRDVVEEEERVEAARQKASHQEAEQRVFLMMGEATGSASSYIATGGHHLHDSSNSGSSNNLKKMTTISTRRLPLRLPPLASQAASNDEGPCVLCDTLLAASDNEATNTECCHRRCCRSCLRYGQSLVGEGQCPVCGVVISALPALSAAPPLPTSSRVKREAADFLEGAAVPPSAHLAASSRGGPQANWRDAVCADSGCAKWMAQLPQRLSETLSSLLDAVVPVDGDASKNTTLRSLRFPQPVKRQREITEGLDW